MLVSAGWLAICGVCIYRLDRWAAAHSAHGNATGEVPLGGSMWAGIRAVAASPYLLGICAYLFLLTMSATVLYMEQAALVGREIPSPEARTRLFAGLDFIVNVLTFVMQVWVTNRLVVRFGLGAALLVLPLVTAAGFAAIVVSPLLPVFLTLTVARRVGEYAIAKPAREVLFTVLNREDKYKAKNFIDTAVSRGGDASTGWLVSGVKALGATTGMMAGALVPLMLLWTNTHALFVIGVFAIGDARNVGVPGWLGPMLVGLLVVGIGVAFGFNAGYAINPARDLGPRPRRRGGGLPGGGIDRPPGRARDPPREWRWLVARPTGAPRRRRERARDPPARRARLEDAVNLGRLRSVPGGRSDRKSVV